MIIKTDKFDNLIIYQPWEPTPDNPAPILCGTYETIEFIKQQQKEIDCLKNHVHYKKILEEEQYD